MTPSGPRSVRCRRTARVLLLDDSERLLLLAVDDAVVHGPRWWITPGGGREPGESLRAAALREVEEETRVRLRVGDLGPHVWTRRARHGYSDRVVDQQEDFLVARLPAGAVVDTRASSELAARWWGLEELRTTHEVIWPRDLGRLLTRLLGRLREGPFEGPPLRLPDAVEDAP